MTDKFGAANRQLVEDTNKGKVYPPPQKLSVNQRQTGAGITRVGDDGKTELYRSLLGVGQEVVGRIAARQEKLDYAEGYNKGLDEGYLEKERSPLRDMLFGPSATMRGAQQRIIDNDSRRWYNARLKSMQDDMMSYDEDEYQQELTDNLKTTLEEYDDPEIKAQISTLAAKQFEHLARTHAQTRQVWVDEVNNRAVEDTMSQAVNTVQSAQRYGDQAALNSALEDAKDMFEQPLDMNPNVWLETTGRVITNFLVKGDELAYKMAEKQGILDMLPPATQSKIKSAYELFEAKNSSEFYTDQLALNDSIAKGTSTEATLVAFKQKYPEQGGDLNKLRAEKTEADRELAEIARQRALTIKELISGDVAFNSRKPEEQREAVSNAFNRISDIGLEAMRKDAYDSGQYDGDMDAAFTQEDRAEYMLDNPMQFAQVWAQHPEVKTPMVQNLMTGVISDFRREELDADGIEVMKKRVAALKQFQALDGGNFHNQFRSAKDAQDFNVYSYMVDAGFNPIDAVRELRLVKDMPEIELADYADSLDESIEDLADEFLDQSPESQGWLGLYNKTPENEETFNQVLKSRLAEALTIYKGDMSKALPAASAALRRNGLVANGQFIPNGRQLDIKGGSLEDYIRGLNADDAMRDQITNSGNGFAPDVDYTTLELSANPFNKKAVLMHGRHETTGQPITISLNLPQHVSHFSTYGFNSFTGYNPNIADTDERKAVFLRNNKLLSTYKTIGKAIDQAVK